MDSQLLQWHLSFRRSIRSSSALGSATLQKTVSLPGPTDLFCDMFFCVGGHMSPFSFLRLPLHPAYRPLVCIFPLSPTLASPKKYSKERSMKYFSKETSMKYHERPVLYWYFTLCPIVWYIVCYTDITHRTVDQYVMLLSLQYTAVGVKEGVLASSRALL